MPAPPEVLVGEETIVEPGGSAEAEVDVAAGAVAEIEAVAEIVVGPVHDGWELERYEGTLRIQPSSA